MLRAPHSPLDLLHTLRAIADKGAGFRTLADAWADTPKAARPADADRARRVG
ncbi:MAG: hypothetical protein WCJ64_20340 [Rhodospirillaceae bacterium]